MVASITQGTTTVTMSYGAEHTRINPPSPRLRQTGQETNAGTTVYVSDAATGLTVERFQGTVIERLSYDALGQAQIPERARKTPPRTTKQRNLHHFPALSARANARLFTDWQTFL
jgi:hypothetical protein